MHLAPSVYKTTTLVKLRVAAVINIPISKPSLKLSNLINQVNNTILDSSGNKDVENFVHSKC